MEWSKVAPKEDGLYWLRRSGKQDTIVGVRDISSGLVEFGAMVAWIGSDWDSSLCDVLKEGKCSWAGPLLPPNDKIEGSPLVGDPSRMEGSA